MIAATTLACLLTARSASAVRQQQEQVLASEHAHLDAMSMEGNSSEWTHARFAQAFPEIHEAASSTCPYGDVEASKIGGTTSFNCNWKSEGKGNTCPELQLQRLRAAHAFGASHHTDYVAQARNLKLKPLFDKTSLVVGDETYEDLDALHIKGLEREEVVEVEDKINLKALAAKLGVPTTKMYFGAHKGDWNPEAFKETARALCGQNVDAFIVKATHLAWSAGQQIVKGWQETCRSEPSLSARTQDLVQFIEDKVLGQVSRDADAHLRFLEPGVTVEELFRTGGNSLQPLEAKVTVLWGKVYSVIMCGSDHRGCQSQSGSWMFFGDKTGWDMKGMINPEGGNDPVGDRVLKNAFGRMSTYAENFAKGVGADYMRVDFFLGTPEAENGDITIMLNECESVSGWPFYYLRQGLGSAWRDGYLNLNTFSLTPEKWDRLMGNTKDDRDSLHLD